MQIGLEYICIEHFDIVKIFERPRENGYEARVKLERDDFFALFASSAVSTPIPAPISITPVFSSAPQASAMRGQTVGFIRKF